MRKLPVARYRDQLRAQLAALTQHGAETVHDLSGAPEELPDPNDRATRESVVGSELRMRDRDRKLMSKIEAALARIDAGTFGLCTSCGEPISEARLEARLVTELCIDCKREAERLERG